MIGTNDDAPADPVAEAVNNPPAPSEIATTAPIAAHRDLETDPPKRPNTVPPSATPAPGAAPVVEQVFYHNADVASDGRRVVPPLPSVGGEML